MTLLELLVVLAVAGVLFGLAGLAWGGVLRSFRLQQASQQLYEDLKSLQSYAAGHNGLTLSGGALVAQRVYLVLHEAQDHYDAYHWRDRDADGIPGDDESTLLWRRTLPTDVGFRIAPGVDRRACSNSPGRAGQAVTFAAPDYPPCDDRPCIKFDACGFSMIGPGAIYLSDGERGRALTMTRPGRITLCRWEDEKWVEW